MIPTHTVEAQLGALFVDFENVFYALINEPLSLQREAALSATMEAINQLRGQLRDRNYALVIERSYADWERLPDTAQRQLQLAGVLPRFVDARVGKSTADIELSLDILYHLLTRTDLRHVVLVGGDRDYLPILRRVKEENRGVSVCSLKTTLAGDVREFAAHYAKANIIELDGLVDLARYPRALPAPPPAASTSPATTGAAPAARTSSPSLNGSIARKPYRPDDENYEWHERYVQSMMRFMHEKRFREIHLGPFFRWLQAERVFELMSGSELRRVFDELQALDAVRVEERQGEDHGFSVATLNYNHPLVRKVNAG